ncbi:hypothetical protein GGF46_001130 [Coemansia sp. RSA 552]|nr:hypothetical protein GGF46_001130 [Coemansia sp. RSA 552]
MLALQPAPQPHSLLAALGNPDQSYCFNHPLVVYLYCFNHPLVVYLSNSIRRDVRLLAAMGIVSEPGVKVVCSYLPGGDDVGDADADDAVLRALSAAAHGSPKRLSRQRSETAPLRPAQQQSTIPLQTQRRPGSPRKEKPHRHEGLGARLGAFFKLALDPETSPRSGTKATFSQPADDSRRTHERSLSDAPRAPQLAQLTAALRETSETRLPHRVTVSHCQTPLGIQPKHHQQLLKQDRDQPRKPSQGSQRSGASSAASATISNYSSAGSAASTRSSGVSTLANRKRSFTHLGLSMESMPAEHAPRPMSPLASSARSNQLRRMKPAANISSLHAKLSIPGAMSEGMARLAAPSNSLGLVLQSSSAALAAGPNSNSPMPAPVPIRAQRHHSSFSAAKEPKSPTGGAARLHSGGTGLASPRRTASPPKSAAPSTLAFPPMPSDACQAAMLSESTASLVSAQLAAHAQRASQQTPPPAAARALSDSSVDSSLASLVLVATATYDYTSGVKGDLEFAKGERIVIQSKVNDDWWFGSILPKAGRGSTGRSGMFPRSHVALV